MAGIRGLDEPRSGPRPAGKRVNGSTSGIRDTIILNFPTILATSARPH